MFDLKNRRAFLKKTAVPSLAVSDLFIGAIVPVYARQLKVVAFGDAFTERAFAVSRQRTFLLVPAAATPSLGKIVNAAQKSGFAVADLKMVAGKGTGMALVADGAVQKLEDLVPELEAHFGAGCASAAAGVEASCGAVRSGVWSGAASAGPADEEREAARRSSMWTGGGAASLTVPSALGGGGEVGGSAKSTASETPAGGHGVCDEWRVPGVHGKGAAGAETRCAT